VIDDESKLRELVGDYLRRDGFAVVEAGTGRAALDVIARARPDLVILDLGLPDVDGEDLPRSFRRQNLPVVVLTAKASEPERVAGLRAGADDYLVKPFSPRELIARVEAVLRRSGHVGFGVATAYGGGALLLDTERREVAVRGREVALTRSEFDLLAVLAGRPGRVVPTGTAQSTAGQRVRGFRADRGRSCEEPPSQARGRAAESDAGAYGDRSGLQAGCRPRCLIGLRRRGAP